MSERKSDGLDDIREAASKARLAPWDSTGMYQGLWRYIDRLLDALPATPPASETVLDSAYRMALMQIEHDGAVINRLTRALHVAAHSPHDQDGEPDPDSGFPVCSVCGAIQTEPPASETVEAREALTKIARLLEPYDAPEPGWPQRYPPIAAQEEAYATACAALDAAPEDAHKP